MTGKGRMALGLLALAPVIAGCSGAAGVQLSTDGDTFRKGETITVTLTNGTSERLGYNLCPTAIEQKSAGWAPIKESRFCTMESISMPPGGRDSTTRELPFEIEPGVYRLSLSVNPGEDERRVISNEFRVR